MSSYFIGACAFRKAIEPHTEACYRLGVYALGWGSAGDLSGATRRQILRRVEASYPSYKREPREAADMLGLLLDMKPGDEICFRHRYKTTGSVIVAFGKVTSRYYWSEDRNQLFEGHGCSHRVRVDWSWFDPDHRPLFPESVWLSAFGRLKQGKSLVRATLGDWKDLKEATRGYETFDELTFGDDE